MAGQVPREWTIAAMTAAIVAGLISAAIWAYVEDRWPWAGEATGSSASPDDFVGGCEPFNLHAQNEFEPYGTLVWEEPNPNADRSPGFAPNELVPVDGWVRSRTAYEENSPPWDSNAWFHLANNGGWVSYAGVRANPTVHDPENGFGPGNYPAPLDSKCAGTYRAVE